MTGLPEPAVAPFVVVTDRLPSTTVDGCSTLTELADDPVTHALTLAVSRRQGVWLGRSRPQPPAEPPPGVRAALTEPIELIEVDVDGAVDGYDRQARQALWPLYHDLVRPASHHSQWQRAYRKANLAYATSIAAHAARGATVWVHDYHLQLVPGQLRRLRPDLRIGFFLHTGFPPPDLFRQLPMRREILTGLMGADLIGFQTASAAENFLRLTPDHAEDPVYSGVRRRTSGAAARVPRTGMTAKVGVFPTAARTSAVTALATQASVAERAAAIRTDLGARIVVLSMDTGDEASGVSRRLQIIGELFASQHLTPSDVAFIQVVRSTESDPRQKALLDPIGRELARVNGRYASIGRPCVHYVVATPDLAERVALYRAADVLIATPLRQGTNLPALEYVAATDGTGAVILSEFTGTAAVLPEAFIVNPYDRDQLKAALLSAISTTAAERRERMIGMRRYVDEYDIETWAHTFLAALADTRPNPARHRRQRGPRGPRGTPPPRPPTACIRPPR